MTLKARLNRLERKVGPPRSDDLPTLTIGGETWQTADLLAMDTLPATWPQNTAIAVNNYLAQVRRYCRREAETIMVVTREGLSGDPDFPVTYEGEPLYMVNIVFERILGRAAG